ncbi:hypothetical protein A9K55_000221 [Cordyceps militaris]|uniref:Uncharacterized protein n=1 Tax=Cordyceps militaris TaxID=73501 RepID=A0A2H4SVS9_CORMI|nr:hypothetical protein A9K55_000221 [Cordyceps militaris]
MTNPCGGGGCWGLEVPRASSGNQLIGRTPYRDQRALLKSPGDLEKAPKRKENGVRGVHGGEMVRFHDFR